MKKAGKRLLHTGAAALFLEDSKLMGLMSVLMYQFSDAALLKAALTHATIHPQKNNQRLEFLGDAVLQLVISQALYERKKDNEGRLTFKRQKLVNEQALAQVARRLKLGDYLQLSQAFANEGGASQDSVLADAMEAVLAAIYLDGGLDAAKQVILHLWHDAIQQADASLDAKGALQAYLQARGISDPQYIDVDAVGPPHLRLFTAAVLSQGKELARASGKTKRAAQQAAAQQALESLKGGEDRDEADQA